MNTGSLRRRVILTTLAVLAIVLAVGVTAVTLAYRAKLNSDLRNRLANAATAIERVGPGLPLKRLVPGITLEGIAIRAGPAASHFLAARGIHTTRQTTTTTTVQARGPLLILYDIVRGRMLVSFSASRTSIDHAVKSLLIVELVVAAAALALGAILVLQSARTALRPLSTVVDTATRIAHGDTRLRLNPNRTNTELGRLAVAFDRMLDALETAIDEARASDAATRRFLADASHELRTPIASLQASIETLLREQPQRPERDRLEAAAARDSERLGRLVNDLLSLARLEAHPSRAPVNLAAITRPLLQAAQTRAPHADITLTTEGHLTVDGDADALERVLRNLIDNALTAIGPTGRIQVHLRQHNGDVQALITDDGPGVPRDQQQRIFERFVRLDPSKPGHGLGLAIARRIANQHDGDLTCDPTPTGARFTLRLPTHR